MFGYGAAVFLHSRNTHIEVWDRDGQIDERPSSADGRILDLSYAAINPRLPWRIGMNSIILMRRWKSLEPPPKDGLEEPPRHGHIFDR